MRAPRSSTTTASWTAWKAPAMWPGSTASAPRPRSRPNATAYAKERVMIINWHAHVMPPSERDSPTWQGKCPATLENLLRINEEAGVDMSVVSNPVHYIKGKPHDEALKAIQEVDDFIAESVAKAPDKLVGFASSVPGGGPGFLKELERGVKELGLRGVIVNSSHNGHYPDEDEARGFFELVTALDIPVFVHAPAYSFGEECMRMYRLISSV